MEICTGLCFWAPPHYSIWAIFIGVCVSVEHHPANVRIFRNAQKWVQCIPIMLPTRNVNKIKGAAHKNGDGWRWRLRVNKP